MAREILIADSDKGDQEEFQRIFGTTGYQVVFSDSGEDALLRVKLFKPDLVIAGVGLSEKNGLELCETIKQDSDSRQIPFILLTGMFEEVTEKDRLRVGADGVITKPLQGKEILGLVDQLIEETKGSPSEQKGPLDPVKKGMGPQGRDAAQSVEKEAFVLEGLDDEDEEIIDLVELVEEPEPKMSIDDFITTGKTEAASEITPLDTWNKLFVEEEKKIEAEAPPDIQELSLDETKDTAPRVDLQKKEEVLPEEELFEKIELEEILEKVEQLQPSIEKEWPEDKELEKRIREALPTPEDDLSGKWMDLNDFEKALKAGVKEEEAETGKQEPETKTLLPFPDTLEAFTLEETKEKEAQEPASQVVEAPPEEPLPSFLAAFETPSIEEPKEAVPLEPVSRAVEVPVEEEPLAELAGEELPLDLKEEELDESQIRFIEMVVEGIEEKPVPQMEAKPESPVMEPISALMEEPPPTDLTKDMEISHFIQEGYTPSVLPAQVEAAKTYLEKPPLPHREYDRQMEETIGKGVQEMMEGFITKVLPEMTQTILNLTMERIEGMVREVVPDLAEKAIREEIKKLQKGEKE